jgi:ribosome biogenesis GTPase
MDKLSDFGWTAEFMEKWQSLDTIGMVPARVVADFGTSLKIATPEIVSAELSGKLAHYSDRQDIPKVGDWVAVRLLDNSPAVVEEVVPRRNEFVRKVSGKRTVKQVIAANIDLAFVLLALDDDFSVERLKRYLYQLSADKIEPVIVLNKADKTEVLGSYVAKLESIGLPIIVSTATDGLGINEILGHISPGLTAILLGSSGVGKSTITNKLLGREVQITQAVRQSDSTGKHTTVHRELFVLPNGGLLIDTPGIRELQLWGTEEDLSESYDDILELASQCKYSNCQHGSEEGCAIRKAIDEGSLSLTHYNNYLKMRLELVSLKEKNTVLKRTGNRKSHKKIQRQDGETLDEMQEDLD